MKNRIILIITIIILILSTSCMGKKNQKSIKVEQKEKAPKTLVGVLEGIDEVVVSIDKIEKTLKLSETEFEVTENKKDKSEDKTDKSKKDEKDKENKTSIKDKEITEQWKDIDQKVEKIHKDWNDYEVEGMKKGANLEKGKAFKRNLNAFTTAVENRKVPSIMDNGSKAIFSLASFFDLYKDEINGDLCRIKHATYQSYLNAQSGNIQNANKLLGSTEEYITSIRQRLDKDKGKKNTLDKLSLAIADMKQSLKDDSVKLLEIKRNIILKNIKAIEK